LLGNVKVAIDNLIILEIYKPQIKFKENIGEPVEVEDGVLTKHPFAGFLSSAVCLMSNLSFEKREVVEEYWLNENKGWPFVGLILSNTKLDIDNPTLREWCLLFIRHVTSWSDKIRERLKSLSMLPE
jgi:hypothetical protein